MQYPRKTCVKVSALEGGHLTLPEKLFIDDADQTKLTTVPSLSFLIQHPGNGTNGRLSQTKMVFDLGLKRDLSGYMPAQQAHIARRQPVITSPDVSESLSSNGLDPASNIDIVILSHVHWDHIGTPSDFENAQFIVGSGTLDLLRRGAPHYPADTFDSNMLPFDRTFELPPVPAETKDDVLRYRASDKQTQQQWTTFAGFPHALDFFGDGSVWIIDSPGHLPGHVNLLARIGSSPDRWVYLGGDCCHDVRILRGQKQIALYDDGCGSLRSVHVSTKAAEGTLRNIKKLLRAQNIGDSSECSVEVIVAHDKEWRETHPQCFYPGHI